RGHAPGGGGERRQRGGDPAARFWPNEPRQCIVRDMRTFNGSLVQWLGCDPLAAILLATAIGYHGEQPGAKGLIQTKGRQPTPDIKPCLLRHVLRGGWVLEQHS